MSVQLEALDILGDLLSKFGGKSGCKWVRVQGGFGCMCADVSVQLEALDTLGDPLSKFGGKWGCKWVGVRREGREGGVRMCLYS